MTLTTTYRIRLACGLWLGPHRPVVSKASAVKFPTIAHAEERLKNLAVIASVNPSFVDPDMVRTATIVQ